MEKSIDGTTGSLAINSQGVLSVGSLQRKLLTQPASTGWKPVEHISDWIQGAVSMADELNKVDAALQHTYSPAHKLADLMHQHREHMVYVYDTHFRVVCNPATAFKEFVAMEEAVRRKLSQMKPLAWAASTTNPIIMKVVKAHALRAEQALANSPGGWPPAGPGIPSPPVPAPTPGTANPAPTGRTDLRTQVDFPSLGAMVNAYGALETRNGDQYCIMHNFSTCKNPTETEGGRTFCKAPNGKRRLHICVRCGGPHAPEGAGKCSKPHLR